MAGRAKAKWYETLDFEALTSTEASVARARLARFESAAEAIRAWPPQERHMLRALGLPVPLDPPAWRTSDDELRATKPTSVPAAIDWLIRAEVPWISSWEAYRVAIRGGYWDTVADVLARASTRVATMDAVLRYRATVLEERSRVAVEDRVRGVPPSHPLLKRAWASLRALERDFPFIPKPALEPIIAIDDPPALSGSRARVLFEEGRIEGSPTLGEVRSLLDALTAPSGAELRAQLLRAFEVPRWRRDLVALDRALARGELPPEEDKREVGWMVRLDDMVPVPVLCRPKKTGSGYVTRLLDRIPLSAMSPVDERAAECSAEERLRALIGHPRVFVKGEGFAAGVPVRVRPGAIAVRAVAEGAGYSIGLAVEGRPLSMDDLGRVARGARSVALDGDLWVFDPRHSASAVAALVLARGGISIPADAAAELATRLPGLAAHVAVDADPTLLGRAVDADPRPLVRFTRTDRGIDVEVRVQPIPEVASLIPGEGADLCVASRDGRVIHVRRDRDAELAEVLAAIAPLELGPSAPGEPFRWSIEDLPQAVAVVDRARERLDALRLSWSGDRIRLASRSITATDLRLRVREGRDWFGLDGDVSIDGQSVRLGALLEAALEGHGHVKLSGGQWAGLSEGLRAQLAAAAAVSDGEGAALGPQHAALVDALQAEGADVVAPPRWFDLTKRSREARDLDVPLPDGLRAELRAYQVEGFTWLARLAHWAPGACLADDMGLGKTLQSLALLLHRRDRPSMVVAPTSVVANWAREAARFAPSLRVRVYHGGGRSLDGLAPGDLVLTSYGVLLRDGEALAKIPFGTAILDEAQAIKNSESQRAKAAYGLDAEFRLALSGTPVENRTSELWSLFRFVSPGLLGTPQRFFERFVNPIERGDRSRRALLARVVAPFLLRRTKSQVERDLPDRTEVRVDVELSPEERSIYDRARLEAATRMQSAKNAHFKVFEELLHLRKLACNVALVDPGTPVASSKLRAIVRSLTDLREAGHRALVFSSFTSHLALVRPALEAEGFAVRYLDGSMNAKQRMAEVDAFQSGEGDVFLISLKAGGVGLNLTAATYVLHLDPWWNPAAEDQATDRAHRIGQTRAVTVLRFVARGTVEDQILRMHETKRELADALLSASGDARPVTADQLLALLAEVDAPDLPAAAPVAAPPPPLRALPPPAESAADPDPPKKAGRGGRSRGKAEAPTASPPGPVAPPALPPKAPASSAPPGRPAARAALIASLERQLSEVAQVNTRTSYRRALGNLLDWIGSDPLDLDALPEQRRGYLEAIERGEVKSKADKVYVGPALNRAIRGLDGGSESR